MYTENRNSTLILYSSRGGTARAYAERLCGMRDCDMMESKDAKLTQLRAYETIIWMGGVYAGRIEGLETLQKYHKKLTDQRLAIFAIGAAIDEFESKIDLPGELSEIPLFYARGRWNKETMSWKDQMMLGMLKAAQQRKPDAVPEWMRELLTEEEPKDFMEDYYLEPLLDVISGR